ncbi:hypothetical protein N0V92_011546 [Colletotrichum tropicale]|nr:hypothetical protein N0V92_011546 [Colletotrichum tropicale]
MEEDEEFDPIKYESYARLPDVAVDELGRSEWFKCDGPEKIPDVDDVWREKAPELYVDCPPRVNRKEAEEKEAKKYEMRLEAEHEAKRIDALFRSLAANPITWPASPAPPALLPAPALLADPALLLAPAPILTAAAAGAGWSTNLLSPAPTPASSAIVATGYHGDDDDEGEYYDESYTQIPVVGELR